MKREHRPLSVVREKSPFATPPHIVVVAENGEAAEALELAEALDEYGAEAEVRLAGDVSDDHHSEPDAVIFAGSASDSGVLRRGAVCVAVTDGPDPAGGFDLVVRRPVNASTLMERLGECLTHHRM